MLALSLWQPWGSLWCSPFKINETRHYQTQQRGWIAVHAAKKLVDAVEPELDEICRKAFGAGWRTELPTGAVVGFVRVVDCWATSQLDFEAGRKPESADDLACGNFNPNRFAWKRKEYRVLREPIKAVGRQGFWNVPDDYFSRECLNEHHQAERLPADCA